jgi:hypothetical protein
MASKRGYILLTWLIPFALAVSAQSLRGQSEQRSVLQKKGALNASDQDSGSASQENEAQSNERVGAAQATVPASPSIIETVKAEFRHQGGQLSSIGEVLVDAEDGGKLLLTPDGQMWTLQPEDILSCETSLMPMKPLTSDEIYTRFRQQVPEGFQVYKTAHYVLIYNTSETYARWVGELFEKLYRGFHNYWKSNLELAEPRFPLVAVLFNTKESYLAYAEREIGDSAKSLIGYYNMQTNRMIMFDMTGVEGLTRPGSRLNSAQLIAQVLSQPQAERTVATIVHEAVHQLSYNTGLQVRLADNPLWVSEGMATFFEAPDVNNPRGWSIGKMNYHNLRLFAAYLSQRPEDSLTTLITDDSRFHNGATASSAYAESWALTYYLMKAKGRREQYAAYLSELRQLKPLAEIAPRERVAIFKKHFGEDLKEFDKEFIAFMRRIR